MSARVLFRNLPTGATFRIKGRKALLVKTSEAFARPAKGGTILPIFPGTEVVEVAP